jgi:hypothetical protein
MRVPGTLNLCKGKCEPRAVTILEHNGDVRYEPDDFEPYLVAEDDAGVDGVNIAEVGEVKVTLRADAAAPPEKLAALREANPRFELTWTFQRSDLGNDASRYCMSIDAYAVGAGWSDQEVADAIVEFRREHADELKLDNPHFWRLTIGKPRAKAAKKEREKREQVERARVAVERAINSGDPGAIYLVVSQLCELPVADRERLIARAEERCGRKLNKRELRRAIDAQAKQRTRRTIEVVKPKICVNQPWDVIVKATAGVLSRRNQPPRTFERGAALCRLQQDERGRKQIVAMTDVFLRGEMGREICYYAMTLSGEVDVPPPTDVARDLLQRMNETVVKVGEKPFPPLLGLVEVPTLRADGSILDTPGYDEATGLYYWPAEGLDVPTIPSAPTGAQLKVALEIVDEAIGDFPFDAQVDRANAYALLLTLVLRHMVGLVPLALVDAPQAGTGKSLLSSVAHVIATGAPGVMSSVPAEDDEMRKLLTAALLEGAGVIILDNADGVLFHPSLSKALTAQTWADRKLGESKTISVPQLATWIVNGNNIQLGRDLPRRCYKIRLDARSSKPWDDGRKFKHPNLINWVTTHRGRIIAALLTLCRAWYAGGRPDCEPPRLGSFEGWSFYVGNILAHAGIAGFLTNRDEVYEQADQDGPQWERFFTALHHKYGDKPKKVGEIEDDLPDDAALREALPDAFGSFVERVPGIAELYRIKDSGKFKIKLGRALQHFIGRRFGSDGLHLVRDEDAHAKVATWKVVTAGSAGAGGSVPARRVAKTLDAHTSARDAHVTHVLVGGNGQTDSRDSPDSPQDPAGQLAFAVVERQAARWPDGIKE